MPHFLRPTYLFGLGVVVAAAGGLPPSRLYAAASITAAPPSTSGPQEQDRLRAMQATIYANQHPEVGVRARTQQHVFDLCNHYWSAVLPTDPPPAAADLAAYKANPNNDPCQSEDLYLGSQRFAYRPDYVRPDIKAARACAILHVTFSRFFQPNFEGYQMLSILSANGEGIPQSWPAAMHYACMSVTWGLPDEHTIQRMDAAKLEPDDLPVAGMGFVLALERAMQEGETPGSFDGCDHAVDDENLNIREIDDCKNFRTRKIMDAVLVGFSNPAGVDPYPMAENDASFFNELIKRDTAALASMTIAGPAILENAATERSQYDAIREEIAAKAFPSLTAADLAKSDTELNRVYKEMKCWLQCRLDPDIGQAFQDAERSWLGYRDTIVSKGVAVAQPTDAAKVKTALVAQLTQQRVEAFNRWISDLQPVKEATGQTP